MIVGRWVLAYLKVDEPGPGEDQADPLGAESVWHQGNPVGQISSGGYGYAAGHYLAFAFIPPELNKPGEQFAVMILGRFRRAVVLEGCVYDSGNLLPRTDTEPYSVA